MDPNHCIFADPYPAVFLNVDPDPILQNCGVTLKLCKMLPDTGTFCFIYLEPRQYGQLGFCSNFSLYEMLKNSMSKK